MIQHADVAQDQGFIQGGLFIQGQWRIANGVFFEKYDPLDQRLLWRARAADEQDVVAACQAAREAFPAWALSQLAERIAIIQRFAILLEQHKQPLARIISQETSKPYWETLTEIQAMIGKVALSVQAYQTRTGTVETALADGMSVVRHRPHGVLAILGPYNFPGHLPNGHIVPALLAGNTLVFKPSELTPQTAEETIKLWQQAGIPDGVLNLLQGGRETGALLRPKKY